MATSGTLERNPSPEPRPAASGLAPEGLGPRRALRARAVRASPPRARTTSLRLPSTLLTGAPIAPKLQPPGGGVGRGLGRG